MSILLDEKTKLIVQGITGRDGSFHTQQMLEYGTNIVAGVTPKRGGQKVHNVPVFNTMKEAVKETDANASVIYVPAAFAVDAIYEAADAGISLIVCISEGVPANDMMKVMSYIKEHNTRLIGPNCPGIISPAKSKIGIMPGNIFKKGNIGVVSRSGTLTYEVAFQLTNNNYGQSTVIGIGGDQIIGTRFIDTLRLFEADSETKAVVLIGEIGGSDEEEAADFISANMTKPVVSFIAGQTAPKGKRMGHAGAIVGGGGTATAKGKIEYLMKMGIAVAERPIDIVPLIREALK